MFFVRLGYRYFNFFVKWNPAGLASNSQSQRASVKLRFNYSRVGETGMNSWQERLLLRESAKLLISRFVELLTRSFARLVLCTIHANAAGMVIFLFLHCWISLCCILLHTPRLVYTFGANYNCQSWSI